MFIKDGTFMDREMCDVFVVYNGLEIKNEFNSDFHFRKLRYFC